MRDRDGTLVFVEVRARADMRHGGAAASIGAAKRARLVFAARHYLAAQRGAARLAASTWWRSMVPRSSRCKRRSTPRNGQWRERAGADRVI
jgi:hypothetical protein